MKNFSKTIAAISLSLLTVGAMAQSRNAVYFGHTPNVKVFIKPIPKGIHVQGTNKTNTHKFSSPSYSGYLNYPDWDYAINSNNYVGGPTNIWNSEEINMRYTKADTGATKGDKNYELIHSFTVAYDSLWDVYSQTPLDPNTTKILSIDTVWAIASYKNTSLKNDTIIFQGVNTVNGYPGATQLFADTVIVGNVAADTSIGQYFGDSLDAGYYIGVLPNYVPATNSFAVNVKFYGSKADTFDLFYGFPDFQCSPYEYANQSSVGIPLSGLNYCNTFTTGWITVFGSVTEMPTSTGGFVYYGVACSDTGFYYEQDAAIFASFTYTFLPGGINNINVSGLSVAQNYPNPFNKETTINYSLTKSSTVTFTVYDITGRVITATSYGSVAPGQYQINLNSNSFSPGIYFYTFNVNGSTVTNKMVITE